MYMYMCVCVCVCGRAYVRVHVCMSYRLCVWSKFTMESGN